MSSFVAKAKTIFHIPLVRNDGRFETKVYLPQNIDS